MKIFVTVGTTKFNSLIEFLDRNIEKNGKYEIEMQISDGDYKPSNWDYFDFTANIQSKYDNCDVVITHAGAGSIYKLLEMGKKIIIVPNLDRIDSHQTDIATYMDANNHAISVSILGEIPAALEKIQQIQLKPFEKIDFFKAEEIVDFILVE